VVPPVVSDERDDSTSSGVGFVANGVDTCQAQGRRFETVHPLQIF
jgi:hypothetical protein